MSNAGEKMKWMPSRLASIGALCVFLFYAGYSFGQTPGTFANTGSMAPPRYGHTATPLPNGQVLIAGGVNNNSGGGYLSSAELYNPTTGAFSTTGSMHSPRQLHTATPLPNGLVLIAGGYSGSAYLSTAELYNPATGTFSTTGSMRTSRSGHTATLLANGMVLIAGGYGASGYLSSSELYDPATGTFTATGNMTAIRYLATATLLANGQVLVAGGYYGNPISSAELYNPATGGFTATGSMAASHYDGTATLLGDGEVLVAGGVGYTCYYGYCIMPDLSSAELYNPSSGTFSATGSMTVARSGPSATLLDNGTVLVAGGGNGISGFLSSAELYDPGAGRFTATGSMSTPREYHTATLLQNGLVLMAAGVGATGLAISSAELYDEIGYTGYVDPKFIVVGVTYAPPGLSPNTWVDYANSTFVGSTQSLSNSFMTGDTYSVSATYGFHIPFVGGGKITNSYSGTSGQTTTNSSSVTMTFQTSTGEKTFGTDSYWAPVDNDYDIIWVWLNPSLIFTVSNTTVTWNGYGVDQTDQPGMDIVPIPLGYLNGDFGPMPPDLQTSLNRSWAANQLPSGQHPAVTSADYPQIASADPFSVSSYGPDQIGSDPPSPETPDHRFTMSSCTQQQSFDYLQAAPSQTPPIYTCALTYTNTSTQAKNISSTFSQTFSYDQSFSGGGWFTSFSLDLKNSNTLTWTTQEQSSITNSTTSTASLSIQGPPCNNQVQGQGPCIPVYDSSGTEPTQFYVYQDNMYGTFMFAPVDYY